VQAGFETLTAAGYAPEMAYFECLHEVKLIVDLMYEEGIAGMRYSISDTGRVRRPHPRPRIVTDETAPRCAASSTRSRTAASPTSGSSESRPAGPNYKRLQQEGKDHPVELVGSRLRAMMPWISQGKTKVADASGGET
jgi:ketol-acid reductoisomerase